MSKNMKRLSSRKEATNTVENDDEMNLSYDCKKVKILPTFTEKDFVRKIWVELAKKEVPLDVFDSDFSDVVHNEHEILIDEISAKMVYQSDIGYNRNEPYIDYESYYEDEPYLATESDYDNYSKTYKTRQVTKYKRVTKERPVTRYKNVIDWTSSSGEYCAYSISIIENKQDEFLNERLFLSSFNQLSEEDIVEVTKDEAKKNAN